MTLTLPLAGFFVVEAPVFAELQEPWWLEMQRKRQQKRRAGQLSRDGGPGRKPRPLPPHVRRVAVEPVDDPELAALLRDREGQ